MSCVRRGRAPTTRSMRTLTAAGRRWAPVGQYLAATEGVAGQDALELRRRASSAQLQVGFVREGLEMARDVLRAIGLSMPKSSRGALVSLLLRRAWLRIRGLGFKPRSLAEISQAELTRVDLFESMSFSLMFVDTFRSMDFGSRFLLAALRLGERWRVSRGLALEADFLAATAKRAR